MENILIGTTDRTVLVFVPDPASQSGVGKTGLAAADITVTLTRVETDNDVVHADVTSSVNDLSALTDAHNDWGWREVSPTLSKGLYRLDIADAAFASGAWSAVVQVTITSGTAAATPKGFKLVAFNELDGVRLGLTALPAAAINATGGFFSRIRRGFTAAAGSTSSTLNYDAGASAVANFHRGDEVYIVSGTGAGQPARLVTNYTTGRVASVAPDWITTPDNTSVVVSLAKGGVDVEMVGNTAIAPGSDPNATVTGFDAGAIDEQAFAADTAKYQAKIEVIDDEGAGTPADRYTALWYKNGALLTSGITVPLLEVVQADAGATALVASGAMTEVGATQAFFRNVTGASRMVSGVAYVAKATATIDGSARTWKTRVGRDSAA